MQDDMSTNDQDLDYKDEEIEIKDVIKFLFRNKKLISIFTFLGIFVSGIIGYSTKKVWKGEFQIVLENTKNQILPSLANSSIASMLIGGSGSQLNTEVEKLKSPSVLMSVFDYVKEREINEIGASGLRFKSWQKSLTIKLQPDTTILNISYLNTDKDSIIPVLSRISETYQAYSGKQRLRNINLGIDYFEDQIKTYKEKSYNSAAETQDFASAQDLRIVKDDILKFNKNKVNFEGEEIFTSIESLRVQAANNIKVLTEQIQKVKELPRDSDKIIYFAKTITGFDSGSIMSQISKIDLSLANARVVFKEKDDLIQGLISKRISLIELLYDRVSGHLEASKEDFISKKKAYERPRGVLIKYRQLLSDSSKDKLVLNDLENNYRQLLLERARITDPWELITQPTLLPTQVAPNKKIYALLGLLIGSFAGVIISFFNEKRKNIIYSSSYVKKIFNVPTFINLSIAEDISSNEKIRLFIDNQLVDSEESLCVIYQEGLNDEISILKKIFEDNLKSKKFICTTSFLNAKNYNKIMLLIKLGYTTRDDLNIFRDKNEILSKKINGVLVLN